MMHATLDLYQEGVEKLKDAFPYAYMVIDELFTFVGEKSNKYYVWAAMVYTKHDKPFYYYRLAPRRNWEELLEFDLDLPKVDRVYSDEAFAYEKMYDDQAICGKGAMTNKIENLNSQMRDKIAYLVRRTKAHAKSTQWLDFRLAIFFNNKNLGG